MHGTTDVPWAVTPEKVEAVVKRLIEVARPRKIIIFGSYACGNVGENSDLDVLVVTGSEVENPRAESVRLRDAVGDIDMPMDIIVIPEARFEVLRHCPGLIYHEASTNGQVVYEQNR